MYRLETTGLTLYTIDWLKVSISLGLYLSPLVTNSCRVLPSCPSHSLSLPLVSLKVKGNPVIGMSVPMNVLRVVCFVPKWRKKREDVRRIPLKCRQEWSLPLPPISFFRSFVLCSSINKQTLSFHSVFRFASFLSVCLFYVHLSLHSISLCLCLSNTLCVDRSIQLHGTKNTTECDGEMEKRSCGRRKEVAMQIWDLLLLQQEFKPGDRNS